jgi:hypothetical protein
VVSEVILFRSVEKTQNIHKTEMKQIKRRMNTHLDEVVCFNRLINLDRLQ